MYMVSGTVETVAVKKCNIFSITQVHSLIKKPQNCRPRDMIPLALFCRKFVMK